MDFIKRWVIIHWNPLIEKIYCFTNKLIKNVPDPWNAKQQYQSLIIKKAIVKQSDKVTYQPETFDTVDVKSFIAKHENISHKLSKTITQAHKLDSNSSLYSDRTKVIFFFSENKLKRAKREHEFKCLAITYKDKILNFFTLNYKSNIQNQQWKVS